MTTYLGTSTSTTNGVEGTTSTGNRSGVYGHATGSANGVYADSGTGYAIEAYNSSTTNATIYANNQNATGCNAIYGTTTSTSNVGLAAAIWGSNAGGGCGVFGSANGTGTGVVGNDAWGVLGLSNSSTGYGVKGENDAGGAGVYGLGGSATIAGANAAVWGSNSSSAGVGVYGSANGSGYGVYGNDRYAVSGNSTDTSTVGAYGVAGQISSVNGYGVIGVNSAAGEGGYFSSAGGNGVHGKTTTGNAVLAQATGSNGIGVSVSVTGASGGYGVQAIVTGGTSVGVMGQSNQDTSAYGVTAYAGKTTPSNCTALYAAILGSGGTGNVAGNFAGTVTKTSGSFKIDHPLDPANKWLFHSFVESPDMMNIYNGVAAADANGEAAVEMPAYFDALNKDCRYQLTAIGAPAPNLHVKEELKGGRFKVAGATPGQRISWQVTGIRCDAFANANRIAVEVEKRSDERGFYQHPEVHGQPMKMGLPWRLSQRGKLAEPENA